MLSTTCVLQTGFPGPHGAQLAIPDPASFPGVFKGSWVRIPAWSHLDVSHDSQSLWWTDAQDAGGIRELRLHLLLFLGSAVIRKGSPKPLLLRRHPAAPALQAWNLHPVTGPLGSERPCDYICGCNPVGHSLNYSPQSLSAAFREVIFCNDMGLLRLQGSPGFLGAHLQACLLESTQTYSFLGRLSKVQSPETTPQGRPHQCRPPTSRSSILPVTLLSF